MDPTVATINSLLIAILGTGRLAGQYASHVPADISFSEHFRMVPAWKAGRLTSLHS
jgi:hypothetical protein